MATQAQQFRPFYTGAEYEGLYIWEKINYKWLLQRAPLLLFAIVSSYGVGHLLSISGLPAPFYQLGAISFDLGFLGTIALSDMQLSKTVWSKVAYYVLNVVMSGLAALFNVLSHANGKYANITPEDITVGIPFAIVGLVFALYYHSIMDAYIDKEMHQQQKEQAELERKAELEARAEEQRQELQLQRERFEAENPYVCEHCGERKPTAKALSNHGRKHK